jgi:hypothetical protein
VGTGQSPVTAETVQISFDPDGLHELDPASTVVSSLVPGCQFEENVIASFCHFVHYFASAVAADRWAADHPGTFTAADAARVGRSLAEAAFPRSSLLRRAMVDRDQGRAGDLRAGAAELAHAGTARVASRSAEPNSSPTTARFDSLSDQSVTMPDPFRRRREHAARPCRDRSATPQENPCVTRRKNPTLRVIGAGSRHTSTGERRWQACRAVPCRAFAERCEIHVFSTPGDRPHVVEVVHADPGDCRHDQLPGDLSRPTASRVTDLGPARSPVPL